MGMPVNQQNRMNITPDGVVYEVLDDGTISKIARVLPNKEIILFGDTKIVGDNWNCPNCGAKEITSKFCPECGTKKPESAKISEKNKKKGTLGVFGKILFTFFALVIIGGGILACLLAVDCFRGDYELRVHYFEDVVFLIFIGMLVQIGVIAWFSALIISFTKRK